MTKKKGLLFSIVLTLLLAISFTLYALLFHTPAHGVPSETAPQSRLAGHYNFLCLGRDRASLCTDVILLCAYNTNAQTLCCVQLPRDTYFRSGTATQLNALFATECAKGKSEKEALRATADAISHALAIPIDYTALLYLDDFSALIDRLGGVEVDIPFAMHYEDPSQNLSIHLEKGKQRLNGAQSEQFVRFRKSNQGSSSYTMGDLGRLQAQKLFLASLLQEVKQKSPAKLLSLLPSALECITCDCSVADAAYFLKHALSLELQKVTFQTLPGQTVANRYVLSRPDTLALCKESFGLTAKDSAFDPDLAFCDPDKIELKNRYYSHGAEDSRLDAERLSQNGLSQKGLI